MAGDLILSLRLTADAAGLKAEVLGAGRSLDEFGRSGQQGGDAAARGLREAARAAEEASRASERAGSAAAAAAANQARAAAAMVDAQRRYNQAAGVVMADPLRSRSREADIAAYGEALDDLRARFNPVFAAGREHRRMLAEVTEAEKVGALSAREATDARARLGTAHAQQLGALTRTAQAQREVAATTRVTADQMRQLAPQINDVVTQLLMGQSPFMIAAQQGGQITQIFGGIRGAASALVGTLGATGIATAAVAGGLAGLVLVADRGQAALLETQQRLRATRADYVELGRAVNDAASAIAESSNISRGDARSAGLAIAGTRGFAGGQAEIERLVRLSADLARVMGTDVPAAAERFTAKAIRDPAAAAREAAAGGMTGFNDALRRQVELLVASGQRGEAARLVIDGFDRATRGASRQTSFLAGAWEAVTNNIAAAYNALDRFLARQLTGQGGAPSMPANAPPRVEDNLRQAEERLAAFREQTRNFRDRDNRDVVVGGFPEAGGGSVNEREARLVAVVEDLRRQVAAIPQALRGALAPEVTRLRADSDPAQVRTAIEAQARVMGVPPELAVAIARQESGFRQTNAEGGLLTSRAGAQGVMQLMPGTARGLGVDATDIRQNIVGGLTLLQQLLNDPRFRGDRGLVAAAYNAGPGRVENFLAGRGALPAETVAYIRAVAGEAGPTGSLVRNAGAAEDALRGRDTRGDTIRRRTEDAGVLERALTTPGLDPEAARRYREALAEIRSELVGLRDPIAEANRRAREQAGLYDHAAGAARELASAELEAREAAERAGRGPVEVALAGMEARRIAQERLTGGLNDTIAAMERQTAAERAALQVVGQGQAATRETEIREWALAEALKHGAEGTAAYSEAVERLTRARRAALDVRDAGTIQRELLPELDRQREELEARRAAIGRDPAAVAADTAERRARQTLAGRNMPTTGDDAEAYIRRAREMAILGREVERQEAAYQELGRIGEQAFDRIGAAITESMVQGKFELRDMKRVGLAVASELTQAFIKLSLINPLKNALGLGNGNAPTLFDIGGLFGGGGGGGAAAHSATDISSILTIGANVGSAILHTGGIVGRDVVPSRTVPASLFANAPRYHAGGMVGPDEVPAILRRGEGVFTPEQMAALGGGGRGAYTFAPTIHFSGNAGSAEDRSALLTQMRAVWMEDLRSMVPGIMEGTKQSLRGDVRRQGLDRALGAA